MSDARDQRSADTVRTSVRQSMVSGFALTIPLLVTVLVVGVVVNTLSGVLDPVVRFLVALSGASPAQTSTAFLKLVAFVVLLCGVFCVGFVAERRSGPGRIELFLESTVKRLPAVGSLYTSFDKMSEMVLDSDTQSFQEVVLVEYPTPGSYTIAFVTANTPEAIRTATGNSEMVTLFMPMAPNPVMGGYVIHVSNERVYDVDMSVEEGIQSIVTSGVAIGEGTVERPVGTSRSSVTAAHPAEATFDRNPSDREPTAYTDPDGRWAAYLDQVDPQHAETPDAVSRREGNDQTLGDDTDTPSDLHREDEQD